MNRWFAAYVSGVMAVLAGFVCWGIYATVMVERDVRDEIRSSNAVAANKLQEIGDSANTALDALAAAARTTSENVNRPCKGQAGPDACGVLAQLNKTVIKAGDAVVTTQIGERQSIPHVIAAMDSLQDAGEHLAKTEDAATVLVSELGDKDTGMAATMAVYRDAGENLNALLKQKAITDTFGNVDRLSLAAAGTMENVQGITKDAKIETDALVAPKTKKQRVFELAPAGLKLGWMVCVLAGHC